MEGGEGRGWRGRRGDRRFVGELDPCDGDIGVDLGAPFVEGDDVVVMVHARVSNVLANLCLSNTSKKREEEE